MDFRNFFLVAVFLAVVHLISSLPLTEEKKEEPKKVVILPTTAKPTTTVTKAANKVTEKPTLGGKMLGGQMGYGQMGYGGFNNMYGSGGMMGGFNNPMMGNGMMGNGMMGNGMMGGMFPMAPGGGLPTLGGSGYMPNWLQQYDMLYSRNRKSM